MNGMLALRTEKWVRISSGLGLLLLVVAQEKVGPSMQVAVAGPQADLARKNASANDPAGTESKPGDPASKSDEKDKPVLPHLVPDVSAPRWPVSWGETAHRLVLRPRDGVDGPRLLPQNSDAALLLIGGESWGWYCFLPTLEHRGIRPLLTWVPSPDPALRTTLCYTGPPERA